MCIRDSFRPTRLLEDRLDQLYGEYRAGARHCAWVDSDEDGAFEARPIDTLDLLVLVRRGTVMVWYVNNAYARTPGNAGAITVWQYAARPAQFPAADEDAVPPLMFGHDRRAHGHWVPCAPPAGTSAYDRYRGDVRHSLDMRGWGFLESPPRPARHLNERIAQLYDEYLSLIHI